jgi:hypothetical protein
MTKADMTISYLGSTPWASRLEQGRQFPPKAVHNVILEIANDTILRCSWATCPFTQVILRKFFFSCGFSIHIRRGRGESWRGHEPWRFHSDQL